MAARDLLTDATFVASAAMEGRGILGRAVSLCSVEQPDTFSRARLGVQCDDLPIVLRKSDFEEYRDAQKAVGPLYCIAAILGHLGFVSPKDMICSASAGLSRNERHFGDVDASIWWR